MIIDGHHHIVDRHEPILRRMDELGIERTVLVGVGVADLRVVTVKDSFVLRSDFLLKTLGVLEARRLVRSRRFREALLGDPDNERALSAIRERPDRFLGFVFVNPESERCMGEIRRCLAGGMSGIKLALLQYPTDLAGPKMAAIAELARERRVPIFLHQGLTREASDVRPLVSAFPDVVFIVAHAGVQYFDEAVDVARRHDNVFVDTSSCMVTWPKLKRLLGALGASKLVFGTDVPVMARDPEEGLRKVMRLPTTDADKERILGGNIKWILRRGARGEGGG